MASKQPSPLVQQINLTWAYNLIENQYLVRGQHFKRSCDTDQLIPSFDWCQLTITCLASIKDTYCSPLLHDLALPGVWLPCQDSKFIFGFGSTCVTRCKFLGAELKILGAQLQILEAPTPKEHLMLQKEPFRLRVTL